jgi:transposase
MSTVIGGNIRHVMWCQRNSINMNSTREYFNPLNAELNPICHVLALLGAHHIFHVSGLRVKGCLKWKVRSIHTIKNRVKNIDVHV